MIIAPSIRLDVTGLTELRKQLDQAKNARVKVGLLGNHADRFDHNFDKEPESNPDIGVRMEFGEPSNRWGSNTPARSFLRMPLMTRLRDRLTSVGGAVWSAIIKKQGIGIALKQLGHVSEATIQEAFNTGGWGQWAPLATITVRLKKSSAILINSAQLRRAVTSKVIKAP